MNRDTGRSGDLPLNEELIRYAWANPADSGQTYLQVSRGRMSERWLVDDAIADVISNLNTDAGREVLVAATLRKFRGETRTGDFAFAARNVVEMMDDKDGYAVIFIGDEGEDKYLKVVVEEASADLQTEANTTLDQIESVQVQKINGVDQGASHPVIYFSSRYIVDYTPASGNAEARYLVKPNEVMGGKEYEVYTAGSSS
ncbi:MAG: hypothetical protein KC583_24850 [Myxococcales bacterium]|nr:hypothetical protein [Myxococcales bacterium]HAE34843.1 hypothetical protein [Bacteroidota bacterium]